MQRLLQRTHFPVRDLAVVAHAFASASFIHQEVFKSIAGLQRLLTPRYNDSCTGNSACVLRRSLIVASSAPMRGSCV